MNVVFNLKQTAMLLIYENLSEVPEVKHIVHWHSVFKIQTSLSNF